MKLPDGIHDLSRSEYDAITDRVNWSSLKVIGISPAHYRDRLINGDSGDTDARKRGRVTHLATYEPEVFRATVAVFTGERRRGKEWEAFLDRNPDKEIVTADMYEAATSAARAARASAMAAPYMSKGRREVTVLWTYVRPKVGEIPGYEIQCKSRLDFLQTAAIVDLKNCRDASPRGFGKQCAELQTYVQAAFYVDAVKAVTGIEQPYVLVAVEAKPPYVCQVHLVTPEQLQQGRDEYRALMDTLHECTTTNHFPGYAEGPVNLTLPTWAVPKDEEDVTGLGLDFGEAA